MRIRKATANDHKAWIQMRAQLWPDCPAARHQLEVAQLLASAGLVVVAEINRELIGFAEISVRTDHVEGTSATPVPYLEGWYVSESWRGKGVGRALLESVEAWARNSGYTELASDAELTNHVSINVHHALGFKEVGRSVHFVKPLT